MAATIYILNGPNLNMLGKREPEIYGSETLEDIERRCRKKASSLGLDIELKQTNIEGELVGWIQAARDNAAGIIINAAAYTHTSVAVHDALKGCGLPVIEVHLSNIYRREPFRHHSYVSPVAHGVICGFGGQGYEFALEAVAVLVHKSGK
jgi:3-dehydroquinate dehydratase II